MNKRILALSALGPIALSSAPASAQYVAPGFLRNFTYTLEYTGGPPVEAYEDYGGGPRIEFPDTGILRVSGVTSTIDDYIPFDLSVNGMPLISNYNGFDLRRYESEGLIRLFYGAEGTYVDGEVTFAAPEGIFNNFHSNFYLFGVGNVIRRTDYYVRDSQAIFNLGTYDLGNGATLVISSVPEPATWAFFILGFGMIGYAMRNRPKTTVTYA